MRCQALSDDRVIQLINANFVAVALNVTRQGFPSELPALRWVEPIYRSNWRNQFGFASCLLLDSTGAVFLGTTSAGGPDGQFSADRFLSIMARAQQRLSKVKEIQAAGTWQAIGMWPAYYAELFSDMHGRNNR